MIIIDTTEIEIKQPKKGASNTIQVRKSVIP